MFGDVNLKEGPVRVAADGTPQNPGAGGWPTLRYFNARRRRLQARMALTVFTG